MPNNVNLNTYYSREEKISTQGAGENEKLLGINEAILAGKADKIPLFSVRERGMAEAYKEKNVGSDPK